MAHAVGTFVLGRPRLGYASSFVAGDPDRIAGTMEIGWAALQDWPQGFHSALDQMRVGAENRGKHFGLEREFGGFSEWLSKTSSEEWARPLRDAFGQYLSAQPSLRTTRRGLVRYGDPEVLRGGYMTRNEAADLLDVSSQTMIDLAERENLYAVAPVGAGVPSLLNARGVEELRARKAATLLKEEAFALLGVGVKAFDGILGLDVLEILPEGERITVQRMFVKSSIEGLIARVKSRLTPARAGAKLLSFSRCGGGRATTDLLRAVLDGRLRPSGLARKAVGLSAFLFDQRDVAAAFPAERSTLNLLEVAAELGENGRSVRAWARAGLLPTERRAGSLEAGSRVTSEGIAHFRREYTTATEISERAATTPRWATHRLAFHGIQPLLFEARTAIYPRDVITEDLLSKLNVKKGASSPSERAAKSADLTWRVGECVAEDLGVPLQRARSSLFHTETGTLVQVMVGRSPRIGASYAFRFSLAMRQSLDGARKAWLALALAEGNSFILLPWLEARKIIGGGEKPRTLFFLAADGQGRVRDEQMRSRQKWLPSLSTGTENQPVPP
ncbi:hypothetical protein [Muricoccus nepalensis]|uniref:hypothetical protein n=1 Tax=Muricoccus nepalensis TaxID=1854500 RepID=UPI001F4FB7B5|nr:hypothetical protein [Roseomonas nepalensis]